MNCIEVQQVLPEVIDGSQNTEFQAHLKSCPVCSELVSDLELIASEARQLAQADEPAPRVWVRIAAELRSEGIIREPEAVPTHPVPGAAARRRWNAWWLAPVAAAVVAAGAYFIKPTPAPLTAEKSAVVAPQAVQPVAKESLPLPTSPNGRVIAEKKAPVMLPMPKEAERNDQQLLDEVSRSAPMMRASYENQLRSVNSYIRDARAYAEQNPDDEDARQHLMDAYEQKSMLYQMALDNVQ